MCNHIVSEVISKPIFKKREGGFLNQLTAIISKQENSLKGQTSQVVDTVTRSRVSRSKKSILMKLKAIYYQGTVLEMRNKRKDDCLPGVVCNKSSQKEKRRPSEEASVLRTSQLSHLSPAHGMFSLVLGKLVECTCRESAKEVQKQGLLPGAQDYIPKDGKGCLSFF